MDTSETFIKMVDCPEIQELWNPQKGDLYVYWEVGPEYKVHLLHRPAGYFKKYEAYRWLPRQDDLEKMISPDWRKVLALEFAYAKNYDVSSVETKCQLDLMIYMRERHGKTWLGTEWVKR